MAYERQNTSFLRMGCGNSAPQDSTLAQEQIVTIVEVKATSIKVKEEEKPEETTTTTPAAMSTEGEEAKDNRLKWGALESNPGVMKSLMSGLGGPANWEFQDVMSMDDECLCWVQGKTLACVFLYPHTNKDSKDDENNAENQRYATEEDGVFYLRQPKELGNACGTIATIHALSNLLGEKEEKADGPLQAFVEAAAGKTAMEIGLSLSADADVHAVHQKNYHHAEAQTQAAENEEDHVDFHFICYVARGGKLFELNGTNPNGAIVCNDYDPEDTLKSITHFIKKKYITPNPDEIRFSLMAITEA